MTAPAAAAGSLSAPPRPRPALVRYYDELSRILADTGARTPAGEDFTPGWRLPPLSPELEAFFAPSLISAHTLEPYKDTRLSLLHLMHNPRTRTTKTFASLLIVARAVAHIRRTGEAVMIVTPSSANKATALRDAVRRAHECGLAGPDRLNIVCVVPSASRHKLWHSALMEDAPAHRRNPVAVLDAGEPGRVKPLARAIADEESANVFHRHGVRLWHTMELANYAVADAARALFERDHLPDAPRVHAHAVSSAFGLLGHFYGQQRHTGREWPSTGAQYLLVQHLGTPDMVASLHHGTFDHRPEWTAGDGVLTQRADPRFPQVAYAADEELDSTFYTRAPATSARMNEIIRTQGGGGIVVSLAECLDRYPAIRLLLEPAGVVLPADPREVREWSLVMAVTGVLNAVDRGLLGLPDVLIHGSGSYHTGDFLPPEADRLTPVGSLADLRDVVHAAAAR